jgi:hypothetical protein
MSAPSFPRLVFFRVPDDDEIHFAKWYCDGRYWAANRWRGWRLRGVGVDRVKPHLRGAGKTKIPVEIVKVRS